ncbi:MAG: beta-galactosidase [Anaerolineae bacterium]|nr:beta-galactosidase [Anaerolineae bacterium]
MAYPRTQKLFSKLLHGADYNYEQWLDSPDILADDFRLMRLAHCNVMSVGIFSWALLEPQNGHFDFGWLDQLMDQLAENNISAALATPSAAPPAWLSHAYPETRRVNVQKIRQPHQRRQNFCYTSPIYRDKVATINRALAERYHNHPALLLWHVSNEYGSSACHCDLCYAAFHRWLEARYGDLDSLNRAWWSTFWSHRYTSWEQIEPIDPSMQALMLDWQRFISDQALDFFLAEANALRQIAPEIPLTTNFMQPDVGLDYWRFAEYVDVIAWDSYPRWHQDDDAITGMRTAFYHDLHRSYKHGQPFLLIESTPSVTNWQGVSRLKKPGMHKLASLQAVAHGSNGVQYFQWRQSRGGEEKFHGAVVTHLNSENTRVFRDVSEVGSILEKLSDITPTSISAPIAIMYDFENEWAIQYAQLSGSVHKNYQETCRRHYGAFWRHGLGIDVINARTDLTPYRVVVAPMLYSLSLESAARIEEFVRGGGIFVTTYLSGLVNESDLCYLNGYPPTLRRTLGIYSEELDSLTDQQQGSIIACAGNSLGLQGSYQFHHYAELIHTESAQVLASYNSDFYAGYPALTVNAHGSGQAYFISPRTEDRFLQDVYSSILNRAGLHNPLIKALPVGVSAQIRSDQDRRYLFLLNFSDQPQQVELTADLHDALTAAPTGRMITLLPYGSSILTTNADST